MNVTKDIQELPSLFFGDFCPLEQNFWGRLSDDLSYNLVSAKEKKKRRIDLGESNISKAQTHAYFSTGKILVKKTIYAS